jgi:hypothetical protein
MLLGTVNSIEAREVPASGANGLACDVNNVAPIRLLVSSKR